VEVVSTTLDIARIHKVCFSKQWLNSEMCGEVGIRKMSRTTFLFFVLSVPDSEVMFENYNPRGVFFCSIRPEGAQNASTPSIYLISDFNPFLKLLAYHSYFSMHISIFLIHFYLFSFSVHHTFFISLILVHRENDK
jgi:hypothetical protein